MVIRGLLPDSFDGMRRKEEVKSSDGNQNLSDACQVRIQTFDKRDVSSGAKWICDWSDFTPS